MFVDRDGVINERIAGGYVTDWDSFRWRPDAFEALATLARARLPIVVVSNQRCVALGLLTRDDLRIIMARMTAELDLRSSPIAAWYCCPHGDEDGCDCRKPKAGMLLRAAREFGFDLGSSYLIGDTDIDAAAAIA
ncbi:MAG TPA: HAD-IIIA family hydrolase, partial [Candidatus Eremiobacteraceae bacterium]|nr:HAD-IIIA family hydrolase [Candidatus Eremiobacteraceae bacterium]